MNLIFIFTFLLVSNYQPVFATENSLGDVNGNVDVYLEINDVKGDQENNGFGIGHLYLNYNTPQIANLSAAVSVYAGNSFWEMEPGDGEDAEGLLLSELQIKYLGNSVEVVLGRQEIELEWLSDYHEALTVALQPHAETGFVVGYSNRVAEADESEISDFEDIGEDGIWFFQGRYEPEKFQITLNPYLMHLSGIHTGYGLRFEVEQEDLFLLQIQNAISKADDANFEDGDIIHVELEALLSNVKLAAGIISTDSTRGAGQLNLLGDTINILDEGNLVFEPDATTTYTIAGINYKQFATTLIYARSEAEADRENEFNLTIESSLENFVKNFSIEFCFTMIDARNEDNDLRKASFLFMYSF